ncbi:hypothetical protein BFJ68_g17270 [Fusarium oxysporum]|uniref:Nephrocystin 3-like N-terminal domain-containing protein n=2 Tax=Fusarium oxysporum TaxID=5507 RepID=A0A420NYB9_FUSOX|nr:hypothetical protein BFJ65_g16953 [Fusarium oxysporum f. sp. cepae]RKK23459.1 hypothetical protein BFJ67_g17169 [Fusarium oxysporum f. sp. cepae]RKK24085.1 hypothetical protein BFJ66_g17233 [Fusarium oxysporum f. sp. cepae]RKK65195.1 hypothetical protein BFJ69_g16506 [Fusarium oxysporum]RKK85279.1 hypothetical protein BFJ68_g17270 [Fusarium oxysporum]
MSGFEALGAAAAAGQFLEQGYKIAKFCHALYRQVKDGPEAIRQRIEQLESLQAVATRTQNTESLQTAEAEKILVRCRNTAEKLLSLLGTLNFDPDDSTTTKTWRAACSMHKEEEILEQFRILNEEKSMLNLHISNLISETTTATHESVNAGFFSLESKLENLEIASDPASEKQKCFRDLFTTDPAADRASIKTKKGDLVQGTCDWIAGKGKFTDWQDSDAGLLWISGGPGMGKTMLSLHLAEHVLAQPSKQTVFLQFFCDVDYPLRDNAMCIVRSLVSQLLRAKEHLVRHILPTYQIQRKRLFQPSSLEDLWKIFVNMVQHLKDCRVVCLLDALDECKAESLELLLSKLDKAVTVEHPLKLVVISREHPRCLKHYLGKFPRLHLDTDAKEEIKAGMQKFIDTRLAELSQLEQHPALRGRVKETLHTRSDGIYLWVSCAVKELQNLEVSEMEAHLQGLPKGLNPLYERMLQQVEASQRDFVRSILRWCAFAIRPWDLEDLIAMLKIQGTEALTPIEVLRGRLGHCGHLVNISEKTVTFVHQSVYDFLTQVPPQGKPTPWFSLEDAGQQHADLASVCLSYMEFRYSYNYCYRDELAKWPTPGCTLIYYATSNWDRHFRLSAQHATSVLKAHPEIFDKDSKILDMYIDEFRTYHALGPFKRRNAFGETHQSNRLELVAADLGLDVLMQHIHKGKPAMFRRVKNNITEPFRVKFGGTTPLHLAAARGHLSIVEMLRTEMPLDLKDDYGCTPLCCAAKGGHTAVVELLLKSGADISVGDPLEWAMMELRVEAVKLLLEWSPSPFITVRHLERAAQICLPTNTGKDSLLSLILPHFIRQKNQKISSRRKPSSSNKNLDLDLDQAGLINSAAYGKSSAETMRLLLQQPGIDLRPENLAGPLKTALEFADVRVVKLLVDDYHAPLPTAGGDGRKGAVHYAAADEDDDRAVQKLRFLTKERMHDPNSWTPGNTSETALSIALTSRKLNTVRWLVNECNVDPEAFCFLHNGQGEKPIHRAVISTDVKVVSMLIDEMKVDVDGLSDTLETPLHYAAEHCHYNMDMYRCLLAAGADIKKKDSRGRTPRDVAWMWHLPLFDQAVEEHLGQRQR